MKDLNFPSTVWQWIADTDYWALVQMAMPEGCDEPGPYFFRRLEDSAHFPATYICHIATPHDLAEIGITPHDIAVLTETLPRKDNP